MGITPDILTKNLKIFSDFFIHELLLDYQRVIWSTLFKKNSAPVFQVRISPFSSWPERFLWAKIAVLKNVRLLLSFVIVK